tara:strand:- start:569 stop:1246 length:678 start_codon:yes stop_codon:yes gene_type:complete
LENTIIKLKKILIENLKKIAFKYLKLGKPNYLYCVEPAQLAAIVNELSRLKDIKANIAEIGVARGLTTRFICEHIVNEEMQKNLKFFAIDTFDSFTDEDLDFEVKNRGKILNDLKGFEYNDFNVWKKNFEKFPFLEAIQSDCSIVDYDRLGPLKLTFLDVDLYVPTLTTLEKVYKATISGGVILVDDVRENHTYDGAFDAYNKFCDKNKLPKKVIGNKCGLIVKP